MLRHNVEINISDPSGKQINVLKGGDIRLREKLLNILFGKQQKMIVLIPSNMVQSISIKEVL